MPSLALLARVLPCSSPGGVAPCNPHTPRPRIARISPAFRGGNARLREGGGGYRARGTIRAWGPRAHTPPPRGPSHATCRVAATPHVRSRHVAGRHCHVSRAHTLRRPRDTRDVSRGAPATRGRHVSHARDVPTQKRRHAQRARHVPCQNDTAMRRVGATRVAAGRGVSYSRCAIRAGARDGGENGITPLLYRASRPRSSFATSPRSFRHAALVCRVSRVAPCVPADTVIRYLHTSPDRTTHAAPPIHRAWAHC